jgi:hypothetical protein
MSSPAQSSASSPAAAQQASDSSGGIHFPATLFGLGHNTSPGARQVARQFTHGLAMMPIFTHTQAAVYGAGPTSPLVVVAISGLSASVQKYGGRTSAAGMRRRLLMMGVTDARRFPAGRGAQQTCGRLTRNGTTLLLCVRYAKKAVGMAMYLNGSASSLSDAASKTNQAVSASGG